MAVLVGQGEAGHALPGCPRTKGVRSRHVFDIEGYSDIDDVVAIEEGSASCLSCRL